MADLLKPYRGKRLADSTPEPFGGKPPLRSGAQRFVVHHHAARNTHFDLRLEMEGVLRSWAVPKGPSPNVADKRFAALVEDHPLEYGDFEGLIPEGNYGAGWSIVWDRGTWHPQGDPLEGMEKGKLLFELKGQKLHGRWTLVRMKSAEKDWLLIKERDDHASDLSTDDYPMGSVFTGLSIEDLHAGIDPSERVLNALEGAPKGKIKRSDMRPMLATADKAFSRKGWLFEIKYDGYRLLCDKNGDEVTLISRNGNDLSLTFPEIVQAVARLPYDRLLIDGEAVVHDAAGMPSFARMQQRGRLTKRSTISRATVENPAWLYAFDLLSFGDYDIRTLALKRRKEILRLVLPESGLIKYSDHIEQEGRAMYEASARMGLEGVVGKNANAKYTSGRSAQWIKVRVDKTDDFVVMGYTEPDHAGEKKAGDIRSLLVGQYVQEQLCYCGRVGSGLTMNLVKEYFARFSDLEKLEAPKDCPSGPEYHWVEPSLVCEVRFKEFTNAGQLRHPVFHRHRDDKEAIDCKRETLNHELLELEVEPESAERIVHFSNLSKVFWPDEGYTKGDLIDYYREISPWLLPWLKDRPLVLTRYPDGIDGKSFYQKDAPEFVPDWIRIEKMWSESTQREIGYFVVDNEEALLYLANMATLPIHVYHSRVGSIEQPDWCVLDLDPKQAPFKDVIEVANAIHDLCDDISLPNYAKTSGSTGIHILLPLAAQFTFEQSRVLGELLARIIVEQLPDISTIIRNPERRDGKVYIDYLQNGNGKLIASAYCARPKAGAPVSMPIKWSEVKSGLTADKFTIKSGITRMQRMKEDPCIQVLEDSPDLAHVLEQLSVRMAT